MDLVRQEAGVSNGSLYHHYPTKAQLADALYAHTLRDFHATIMVPISGRASAQTGVKGMVRAYIQWVVDHPERARLLHELRRSGGLADAGAKAKDRVSKIRDGLDGEKSQSEIAEEALTLKETGATETVTPV